MRERSWISLCDLARVKKELAPGNAYTWNRILELLRLPLEMASAAGSEVSVSAALADVLGSTSNVSDVNRDDPSTTELGKTDTEPVFAPGNEVLVEKVGTSATFPAWSNRANVLADATKEPAVA